MKRIFASVAVLCLASIALPQPAHKESSTASNRVLRVICLPTRPLALTVALERGLFARRGVEVQAQIAGSSPELRTALSEGTSDLAHAAVDNAVALAETAHVDVVVVLGGEGSTNELIAQPGTASIENLRGQTVIVDAPNTAYAIQLKKILLTADLQAGRDYQIKPVGSTPLRLAAMREHKEYAASILGPPTSLRAKHEGFVSLGTTQHFLGAYQGIGAFTRRSWASENRDLVERYIASYVEAQRWILDPAHKSEVVALLEKEFKLSEALTNEAYDAWIIAPGGFEADARIDLDGFRNTLQLRAEIEHTWTGETPGPEKYYDPSYYNAALKKLASSPK
jgi:ABC-type nitrate/sulfonate/bicarbonate transport system substrate-binding protein